MKAKPNSTAIYNPTPVPTQKPQQNGRNMDWREYNEKSSKEASKEITTLGLP